MAWNVFVGRADLVLDFRGPRPSRRHRVCTQRKQISWRMYQGVGSVRPGSATPRRGSASWQQAPSAALSHARRKHYFIIIFFSFDCFFSFSRQAKPIALGGSRNRIPAPLSGARSGPCRSPCDV